MPLEHIISTYFSGELQESLVFILPVGLLSLVFGVWLLTDAPTAFTRGVSIPFLAMGLLMTAIGSTVGFRTPQQVAQLRHDVRSGEQAVLEAEMARMEGVNRRWRVYLVLWAAFGVTGLALRFMSAGAFPRGLGAALVLFAGVGLLVDGFAERRAEHYAAALADGAPSSLRHDPPG